MMVSGDAVGKTSSMCPVSRSTISFARAIFSGGSTVSAVVPSAVEASSSPVSKISRYASSPRDTIHRHPEQGHHHLSNQDAAEVRQVESPTAPRTPRRRLLDAISPSAVHEPVARCAR